jgi:hypothetical protein
MKRTLFAFLFLAAGAAGADDLSGPGRKTLVSADWGTIFCQEGCQVKMDPSGRQYRLSTEKGPAVLMRNGDSWVLQAVNQNIIVRQQSSYNGNEQLLVSFNGERFWFDRTPTEYSWRFPTGKTFFTLREGEVRGALGQAGSFSIHKHTGGASYQVKSDAGESEVLLGRKKRKPSGYNYQVVKQSGEELSKHPLLVRGVVFDNGPIGVYIRLPRTPLAEALPWQQVETVVSSRPFPEPKVVDTTVTPDPLEAVVAPRDEDPLGLKRKPFQKDRSMFDPTLQEPWNVNTWSQAPK